MVVGTLPWQLVVRPPVPPRPETPSAPGQPAAKKKRKTKAQMEKEDAMGIFILGNRDSKKKNWCCEVRLMIVYALKLFPLTFLSSRPKSASPW